MESFVRGDLPRDEERGIVRHLLTGCPACLKVTRRMWGLGARSRALEILSEEADALAAGGASGRLAFNEPGLI